MSWAKLLADKTVTRLPPMKAELDNLRSIVARSLGDVTAKGLSADARFTMAYDAARTLSLMVGAHYNTFVARRSRRPSLCEALSVFRWLPHQAQRLGI